MDLSSIYDGHLPAWTGHRTEVAARPHQKDGKLLCGQIVGKRGAAKRIDTLATALNAGFTLAQIEVLDLGYAPPISPLWDPVAIAARVAGKSAHAYTLAVCHIRW